MEDDVELANALQIVGIAVVVVGFIGLVVTLAALAAGDDDDTLPPY